MKTVMSRPRTCSVVRLSRAPSICIILIAVCTPALALECPLPQPISKNGVLQETKAQIAEWAPVFQGDDVLARTPAIVAQFRALYPDSKSPETVNFLMGAYCPIVLAKPTDEKTKEGMMNAFAAAVMQVIY